jgi:hypothetical protein
MNALSSIQHKTNLRRLEALASYLELKPPERECARGTVSGVEVRLELVAKKELVARACLPTPLPTGLQIESEEARGTPYYKRFQDLQVGVKAFDERVHVRALNPAAALRFLRQEEVLQQLPAFLSEHPQARLVGDELVLTLQPFLTEEQVRRAVKGLVALAEAFGRAGAAEQERGQRNRAESRQALPTEAPAVEATPWAERTYRPRSSHEEEEQESGAAHVRRMRKKYQRLRWWMFGLRFGSIPLMLGLRFYYSHNDWAELLSMLGLMGMVALSFVLWRCPACDGSLATGNGDKMHVRSCPHCGITLDPKA